MVYNVNLCVNLCKQIGVLAILVPKISTISQPLGNPQFMQAKQKNKNKKKKHVRTQ